MTEEKVFTILSCHLEMTVLGRGGRARIAHKQEKHTMRAVLSFLFVAGFALASSTVLAQGAVFIEDPPVDPAAIQQVIDLLQSKETRGFLSRGVMFAVWVVFRYEGQMYTMYHSPEREVTIEGVTVPIPGHLSVWVRPEGTYGEDLVETWSDQSFDGVVDFGIGGDDDATAEERHHFSRDRDFGWEFLPYWQEWYARSIAAALATLH